MDLSQKIKDSDRIERILIPIRLEDLRMNIGIPIFIDWKHAPLKFDEVINWNKRIQLANNFYNYDKFIEKKRGLKEIQKIEKISQILINKNKVNFNCENLIDDKTYSLFRVSDCFID